jgi:hypothetical protein
MLSRTRTLLVQAAIVTFALGGVAVVADALIVTDKEQLEAFAHALTRADASRADAALRHSNPSRVPVDVIDGRDRTTFDDYDQELALASATRQVLAPMEGDVRFVQETVDQNGDEALVTLRWDAEGEMHDAYFRLVRRGDGWLVDRIRVPVSGR